MLLQANKSLEDVEVFSHGFSNSYVESAEVMLNHRVPPLNRFQMNVLSREDMQRIETAVTMNLQRKTEEEVK